MTDPGRHGTKRDAPARGRGGDRPDVTVPSWPPADVTAEEEAFLEAGAEDEERLAGRDAASWLPAPAAHRVTALR